MSTELYGEDELRNWLLSQGFRCAEDTLSSPENECNWYAYRRSALPARRCECNDDKPGMQIVIKPNAIMLNDIHSRSVEVELRGEANGVWWIMKAYSLSPEELPEKLASVEASLIAAWNAMHPRFTPDSLYVLRHEMKPKRTPLPPGSKIEYRGDVATVVEDLGGEYLKVMRNGERRTWSWETDFGRCRVIRRAKRNHISESGNDH